MSYEIIATNTDGETTFRRRRLSLASTVNELERLGVHEENASIMIEELEDGGEQYKTGANLRT